MYFIVHDAVEGRREFPVGAGEVRVCVGDKIVVDEFGKKTRVPVYSTRRFFY